MERCLWYVVDLKNRLQNIMYNRVSFCKNTHTYSQRKETESTYTFGVDHGRNNTVFNSFVLSVFSNFSMKHTIVFVI